MKQQTWAGAVREVWRTAARHKVVSSLIVMCVAASLVAIALFASGSGAPAGAAADPAAPTFSLPVLGQSGPKFYRSEHGKVAIVGLDENDVLGSATSFTHKEGVSYPVGFDPGVTAASAYGVAGLPQTFFLDARHRIVDRIFGAVTLADIHRGIALATGG